MTITTTLAAAIEALIDTAADLQAAGAIRPEHWTEWQQLRTGLEQAKAAAEASAPAEPAPVESRLEALTQEVAQMGAQLAKLVPVAPETTEPAPVA